MSVDRKPDEALVQSLDDQERAATLKRDISALERLWSEDFAVNAPNNQVIVGRRAVLDMLISGLFHFSRFERRVEFTRAEGAYVIIMGLETVEPINNAPELGLVAGQTIERRFTNIWKNEEGTWRLFVRHANVIPKR